MKMGWERLNLCKSDVQFLIVSFHLVIETNFWDIISIMIMI